MANFADLHLIGTPLIFSNLDQLAAYLESIANRVPAAMGAALAEVGQQVADAARDKIGHYQGEHGPFAAWHELADSTKQDRVRKGYAENEPLLRDGTLRASIAHTVGEGVVSVGSPLEIAKYQEIGTDHIPPRSFLGGALVEHEQDSVERVTNAVTSLFEETP